MRRLCKSLFGAVWTQSRLRLTGLCVMWKFIEQRWWWLQSQTVIPTIFIHNRSQLTGLGDYIVRIICLWVARYRNMMASAHTPPLNSSSAENVADGSKHEHTLWESLPSTPSDVLVSFCKSDDSGVILWCKPTLFVEDCWRRSLKTVLEPRRWWLVGPPSVGSSCGRKLWVVTEEEREWGSSDPMMLVEALLYDRGSPGAHDWREN